MRDSRRARVVLAILIIVSIVLITADERGGLNGVKHLGSSIFGPPERVTASAWRPVSNFFSNLTRVNSNASKIQQLENQNADLQSRLNNEPYSAARVTELNRLLQIASKGQYRTVPAQVIAIGPAQGLAWTVTIDTGTRDGVQANMTVINGDGLVGRVTTASATVSTVLLIIDPTSKLGARLESSNELGFVTGEGLGSLQYQVLNPSANIAVGQRIVTFGDPNGRPYVPGVPIGTVTKVTGALGSQQRYALVKPFVDFTALDIVGVVIQAPRTDPRDSVLPAKPTPAPTVTVTVTASPTSTSSPGSGSGGSQGQGGGTTSSPSTSSSPKKS